MGVFLFTKLVEIFILGTAGIGIGGIVLVPLDLICALFPVLLISFVGIVVSSVVIGKSASQDKPLYSIGVVLCGLWAALKSASVLYLVGLFGSRAAALISYGLGSGIATLALWIISDYRYKDYDESLMSE